MTILDNIFPLFSESFVLQYIYDTTFDFNGNIFILAVIIQIGKGDFTIQLDIRI